MANTSNDALNMCKYLRSDGPTRGLVKRIWNSTPAARITGGSTRKIMSKAVQIQQNKNTKKKEEERNTKA